MMRNFTGSPWSALACIALLGSTAFAPTGRAAVHSLPLVLPAGNPALTGFVRIVNRSDRAGEVDITAIDDSGTEVGPITLSIGADSSRHFNSEDLENGNARKGLSDGVGDGQCSWRLELETDLDILPLAFVRTGDGFVTSIHDVVPEVEPGRHDVAIFNPGKNMTQQSRLRLVNPGEVDASVEVEGTDDDGIQSEGTVQLTVPKGGACTVTSEARVGRNGRFLRLRDERRRPRGREGQVAALRHHRPVDSGDERPQDPGTSHQSLHREVRRLCSAGRSRVQRPLRRPAGAGHGRIRLRGLCLLRALQ